MSALPQVVDLGAPLLVEIVGDLAAVESEWSALCDEARAGCLFLSPEWLVPWWARFGGGRELCSIAVREGGRLIGLLPLFRERVRVGGLPIERVAFLGDGATGCDYLDVLAAPGREAEVRDAVLAALGEQSWDVCDLDGIWRESATALALAQRFPAQRSISARAAGLDGPDLAVVRDARLRFVCPHIPLGGTWEEYLQGLGRRENLRRREKWLFRQPGVSIEVARGGEAASRATAHFLELHRARWAVEGGSDGLADERHEEFHRDAIQRLAARGWLRLYTLYAARRPVASVYGVVHRGKFLYYQSGYDPAWAGKSVGLVLLARTVQDAFGEKLAEFDFLRGSEAYKAQWARAQRWTIEIRLWRGARGRAARAALGASTFARETVKAALPSALIEAARRTRRALRAPRAEGTPRWRAALRQLVAGAQADA
jgi:CelD/BcsL family acetyltransferase involved in cellulose biosynthesis